MKKQKKDISTNRKFWEQLAQEGWCGFTQPWLNLDSKLLKKLASGLLENVPEQLADIYPTRVLKDIKGKNVLCLASGGGQQSAVFGLLGANVTVVDLADGQLEGDRIAAKHYGYNVKTYQADISDLSFLDSSVFDLVYQAVSMGYLPDVRMVYSEVSRVLKKGGLYRADAMNPISQFIEENSWDGQGYRISTLFSVKRKRRNKEENVIEFRHTLEDAFNGLLECDFQIEVVQDMPEVFGKKGFFVPGTWEHFLLYAPGHFAILAKKK